MKTNKSEVIGMSIFEFDREEYERQIKDEYIEEGKAEGAYNTKIETARAFLAMGVLSKEQIAQGTGLSLEEVAAL